MEDAKAREKGDRHKAYSFPSVAYFYKMTLIEVSK